MIKVAVVENEKDVAERFKSFIDRYASENSLECKVNLYYNAVDFLDEYTADYDAVFFDIQMPLMDGMTAAEKLREQDSEVAIVFVTNMAQYAIRGYKVNAMDFLVKPVEYFDLALEMQKIARRVGDKAEDYIWINAVGGGTVTRTMQRVPFAEIIYVEILSHVVSVHTKTKGVLSFRGTLKEVEDKLDGRVFSRVSNSHIVNMRCVSAIDGDEVHLFSGEVVHFSRARKKGFMNDLNQFVNRG